MNKIDTDYLLRHYHHDWGADWRFSQRNQLPILNPEMYIPDRLVPFDKINNTEDTHGCVIFNLADRRIDRLWTALEQYIHRLMCFDAVATVDFSLLRNFRRPAIAYNVDRALTLGRKMQELGMRVLPTAMWACPDTYDVCFEALPRNSIILVSTVGTSRDKEAQTYFRLGLQELLIRVKPSGIVLYGPIPTLDFHVPVVRHFDRISPVHFNSYQPEII